ncbi:glycosyltransferase family 4 protein [Clostridium perfringens]|uniref:glycosyltransferase family 4 protein n=1 Tax=Clostridium perfringens TaxID=1502 RepID=UPI003D330CE1
MKNIAIIGPGFLPIPNVKGGAIETLVTQLIEENEKENKFNIDLYTINDYQLNRFKKYKNTKIIQSSTNKVYELVKLKNRILNRICKIIKLQFAVGINDEKIIDSFMNKNYDFVIVENNMNIFKKIHRKNKNYNTKFIFHLHNSIENDPGKSFLASKYIAENSYLILTASNFLKNQFKKYFPKSNVVNLNNCIDFERFTIYNIEEVLKLKNKFNISDELVIGYSGRIAPEKGLREMLLAFEILVRKKVNIKLIIAGENHFSINNKKMKEINEIYSRIKEKIIFTGYIEHEKIPQIYNICDIILVPSICQEAFGLSALESLACGTPVIATNIGGLKEVISLQVGSLIDINNDLVINLANKIEFFYNNRNELKKKSSKCRNYALENFDNPNKYLIKFSREINFL